MRASRVLMPVGQGRAQRRAAAHRVEEQDARDPPQQRGGLRGDGGRPRHLLNQTDLAEVVGCGHLVDPARAGALVVVDHQGAVDQDEQVVAGVALAEHDRPGRHPLLLDGGGEPLHYGPPAAVEQPQPLQHRHPRRERPAAPLGGGVEVAHHQQGGGCEQDRHQPAGGQRAGQPEPADEPRGEGRPGRGADRGQRQHQTRHPAEHVARDAALHRLPHQHVERDDRDPLDDQHRVRQKGSTEDRQRRQRETGQQHEHADHRPRPAGARESRAQRRAEDTADARGGEQPPQPAGAGAQQLVADQHQDDQLYAVDDGPGDQAGDEDQHQPVAEQRGRALPQLDQHTGAVAVVSPAPCRPAADGQQEGCGDGEGGRVDAGSHRRVAEQEEQAAGCRTGDEGDLADRARQ
jgi:hypothetical protein